MIVINTEANSEIGFAHANRCLALSSLIKHRNPVQFIINKDKILERILTARKIPFLDKENKEWEKWDIKAIIVDIYSEERLDHNFTQWTEKKGIPVVVFVRQPLRVFKPNHTITIGPKMIPLHPKFRHFHKIKRKHPKAIRNIFLSMGGRTHYRLLRKTVDVLVPVSPQLKIALGPYLKNSSKKVLSRLYPNVQFVGETDNLARSIFEADLAFITPGMVAHEAAAVGTPALYFFDSSEREMMADFFQEKGAGIKLCDIRQIKTYPIKKVLDSLSQQKRQILGEKGKEMEDGRGIFRIIDFLKNEDII